MRGGERGFSLVELLAALAIVAVLAAVALPAYRRHAYRARRVEGKELLLRIAHAQERHYATYNRYGDLADLGFVEPAWSEQRFYRATLRLGAGDSPQSFVLEDFLLQIEVRDAVDAEEHSAILIGLADLLRDKPDLKVDVFLMNNLDAQYRTRDAGRGFPADHPNAPMNQYFSQTAGAINDRSFFSPDRLSLHLRRFNLGTRTRDPSSADILNITWFALNVPKDLRRDTHVEDRG